MGIGRDGEHKASYTPGVELRGKYTLIAEGVRGSLAKELQAKFRLRDGAGPAKFGIGIKELWQIDQAKHKPGLVIHAQGWPPDAFTTGGRFMYHLKENQVAGVFVRSEKRRVGNMCVRECRSRW